MRLNGKYTVGKGEESFFEKGSLHYEKEPGSFITFLIFYSRDRYKNFSIHEESEDEEISSEDPAEQAMLVYEEFLEGKIDCDGIDIDFITIPTGEPDDKYDTKYAVFDCNGDEEAEFHVKSARYYYVFQYKNDTLVSRCWIYSFNREI